jgi:RNAse (barnase) inhibitor barstar
MNAMDDLAQALASPEKSGVYHLTKDGRQVAQSATDAGLAAFRIDIGHAHDKKDFLGHLSKAMRFPDWFGGNWDALADALKDLSWIDSAGYVVILEKSKHFHDAHRHEFDEAVDVLKDAAAFWRGQGKPFWALVGGAEGWKSGYPPMPV